jgi:hypothetical protein
MRLQLARAADFDCQRSSGSAAEAIFNHLPEITPNGCLAIDMRYNIADFDAGQLRRAASHKLLYNDLAICPGNPVNADSAEILRGGSSSGENGLNNQHDCDDDNFHG